MNRDYGLDTKDGKPNLFFMFLNLQNSGFEK